MRKSSPETWTRREVLGATAIASGRVNTIRDLKGKKVAVSDLRDDRHAFVAAMAVHVAQYQYALQTLKEVPYTRWREFVPEDSVRFYALRLHEGGMIKTIPQKLIAQGTNWRFLDELTKELKV